MGLLRKMKRDEEKKQAKAANKATKKEIDTWWRKVKASGQAWADNQHWKLVRTAQSKQIHYIMELCEVTRYEDIDWNNPKVKVLMMIQDPVIIRDLQNPKRRQRVYDMMTPEMWEFYTTAHDNNDPDKLLRDTIESKWSTAKEGIKYSTSSKKSKS